MPRDPMRLLRTDQEADKNAKKVLRSLQIESFIPLNAKGGILCQHGRVHQETFNRDQKTRQIEQPGTSTDPTTTGEPIQLGAIRVRTLPLIVDETRKMRIVPKRPNEFVPKINDLAYYRCFDMPRLAIIVGFTPTMFQVKDLVLSEDVQQELTAGRPISLTYASLAFVNPTTFNLLKASSRVIRPLIPVSNN